MVKALLGKKIGMTQVFDPSGERLPVTVLQVGPCTVTQVKTAETDCVPAVQIGFEERKRKNTVRPLAGHFTNAGTTPKRILRDVDPDGDQMPEPGQASRALSGDMVSPALRRLTADASADAPAQWAPAPGRAACGRASECRGTWATRRSPFATSKS